MLVFLWANKKGKKKTRQEQEQVVEDIELGGDTFELAGEAIGEIIFVIVKKITRN